MGRRSRSVDNLVDLFTSPELHNMAMIAKDWSDNKVDYRMMYSITKPEELLEEFEDVFRDYGSFSTKEDIIEKVKDLSKKEKVVLVNELIANYDLYFVESNDSYESEIEWT